MAQFFLYVAKMNTEKRQQALAIWVIHRRTANLGLEAANLDEDEVVGYVEKLNHFVVYAISLSILAANRNFTMYSYYS